MHMIRHQAISPDLHLTFSTPFGQQGYDGLVCVVEEQSKRLRDYLRVLSGTYFPGNYQIDRLISPAA